MMINTNIIKGNSLSEKVLKTGTRINSSEKGSRKQTSES
jgi:hypothetical protein